MVGQPLSPRDVLHTAPECESLGLGDPSTPIHRGRKESSGRLCSVPQMPQLKVTETIRPSFFLKTQSLPLIRLPPDGAPAPPPEIGGSAHLTSAWGPGPGRDEARILDRAFLVPPQAVDRPARDPEEAPRERGAGAQPGSRAKLDPHPPHPVLQAARGLLPWSRKLSSCSEECSAPPQGSVRPNDIWGSKGTEEPGAKRHNQRLINILIAAWAPGRLGLDTLTHAIWQQRLSSEKEQNRLILIVLKITVSIFPSVGEPRSFFYRTFPALLSVPGGEGLEGIPGSCLPDQASQAPVGLG